MELVPDQNIDKGIRINDLPNKTGCTSDVFEAVEHKSKHPSGLFSKFKRFFFEVKIGNDCIQIL